MNQAQFLGFPNQIPHVDSQTYLPKFRDDPALHLIRFHMHIHNFKVKFHEDVHDILRRKSKILV